MNTEWKYSKFNPLRAVLTEKSQFMFFETLILGYSKNTFYISFSRNNHVGLKNTWGIKVVFWRELSAYIFLFWVFTIFFFTSISDSGQYFSPFSSARWVLPEGSIIYWKITSWLLRRKLIRSLVHYALSPLLPTGRALRRFCFPSRQFYFHHLFSRIKTDGECTIVTRHVREIYLALIMETFSEIIQKQIMNFAYEPTLDGFILLDSSATRIITWTLSSSAMLILIHVGI